MCAARPQLFEIDGEGFLDAPALSEEVFGAASLIVRVRDRRLLARIIDQLEGQLTVTMHAEAEDHDALSSLLPELELLAGRLVFGGWPTGVEVGHATVHGGPFPATSDSRSTSVGTRAIERFLRPVAYQNAPPGLLPVELAPENRLGLERITDGRADRA
jgi:NADP-dependent aldehyde dehydrogenase